MKIYIQIILFLLISSIITGCKLTSRENVAKKDSLTGLVEINWSLTNLFENKIIGGSYIELYFDKNGSVKGTAGVNKYVGQWLSTNQSLKIHLVSTTKRFRSKPIGVMEQEKDYLEVLSKVT